MTQDLASAIAFQVRSTSGRSVTASTPMEGVAGIIGLCRGPYRR